MQPNVHRTRLCSVCCSRKQLWRKRQGLLRASSACPAAFIHNIIFKSRRACCRRGRARHKTKRVCLIRQERFYIIRKRILSFSERGSGETLFTKRVSPDKHFSEKIINALVSFSGKGQGKTALYKEGFSLENFSEENYKKDFKFLGKGFGENPLFKEGSPRRTLPEKIINAKKL